MHFLCSVKNGTTNTTTSIPLPPVSPSPFLFPLFFPYPFPLPLLLPLFCTLLPIPLRPPRPHYPPSLCSPLFPPTRPPFLPPLLSPSSFHLPPPYHPLPAFPFMKFPQLLLALGNALLSSWRNILQPCPQIATTENSIIAEIIGLACIVHRNRDVRFLLDFCQCGLGLATHAGNQY